MGKIGFSCQLSLSEIRIDYGLSHSTWFHKTTRFSRSKSSRFYIKKIWLSVFYSIRVGEEPDPVLLKKMVTPPLTINYFIYEIHSNRDTCPTETEFVTCYPLN